MAKAKQKIVVDASVARAAGTASMHPVSKSCRETLLAIYESNLNIATCSALVAEWKKHQSNFSRLWLLSMIARGRFDCLSQSPTDLLFRERIANHAETEGSANAMEKDAHLVEIALKTGKRVIALDEVVRNLYKSLASHHPPIKPVLWVNPVKSEDSIIEWITTGCPSISRLELGSE